MTGQEAVDYIHSARGRGKKDGLRKITELMHRLGDPQDKRGMCMWWEPTAKAPPPR